MVKYFVLFDAPLERTRRQIDAVLRNEGYMWLFENARWVRRRPDRPRGALLRRLRQRLSGQSYRILILEISGRATVDAKWLTAISKDLLACR
jgi:hypothetical protein